MLGLVQALWCLPFGCHVFVFKNIYLVNMPMALRTPEFGLVALAGFRVPSVRRALGAARLGRGLFTLGASAAFGRPALNAWSGPGPSGSQLLRQRNAIQALKAASAWGREGERGGGRTRAGKGSGGELQLLKPKKLKSVSFCVLLKNNCCYHYDSPFGLKGQLESVTGCLIPRFPGKWKFFVGTRTVVHPSLGVFPSSDQSPLNRDTPDQN